MGVGALQRRLQLDAPRRRHREARHLHAWYAEAHASMRAWRSTLRACGRAAGGIGKSIESVEQLEALVRPLTMETGGMVLMDLLWRCARSAALARERVADFGSPRQRPH